MEKVRYLFDNSTKVFYTIEALNAFPLIVLLLDGKVKAFTFLFLFEFLLLIVCVILELIKVIWFGK